MSEKKEKNVVARVGNFVIVKESGNGMDWVSVKAVSGFWTVRYREDNKMYGSLLMMAKHEDFRPYLENWITSLYVMANAVPDLDFYEDFLNASVVFLGNINKPQIKIQAISLFNFFNGILPPPTLRIFS